MLKLQYHATHYGMQINYNAGPAKIMTTSLSFLCSFLFILLSTIFLYSSLLLYNSLFFCMSLSCVRTFSLVCISFPHYFSLYKSLPLFCLSLSLFLFLFFFSLSLYLFFFSLSPYISSSSLSPYISSFSLFLSSLTPFPIILSSPPHVIPHLIIFHFYHFSVLFFLVATTMVCPTPPVMQENEAKIGGQRRKFLLFKG